MEQQDIGLIGLAVMGQNLVLNMERNGFGVVVYNRTGSTTTAFMEGPASGKKITAAYTLEELFASLKKPYKVIIMVKAGAPVDEVIAQIKPYLEPGDLIMDGGNSHFRDTDRRSKEMEAKGNRYMGVGIGPRGAGHFVKMVHNAIEYGDMQLIAESYDILHRGLGLSEDELHEIFSQWNKGPLSSYLIEITASIFTCIDDKTRKPLVEMILDEAEQKGTGRWTIQAALDLGVPVPTLSSAVEARTLSAYKVERMEAAKFFPMPVNRYKGDRAPFVNEVGDALYVSKICSYAQGMALLRKASEEYDNHFDCSEIARIWRGGCIIRARFLDDVQAAFKEKPSLSNLLIAPFFNKEVLTRHEALRHVVEASIESGIPTPGMSASLAYFDSYRSGRLPANLIQAQRDYFGAHTYRRVDQEGIFHTKWTE
jgi:6-phosphogluconate dehydrogenase